MGEAHPEMCIDDVKTAMKQHDHRMTHRYEVCGEMIKDAKMLRDHKRHHYWEDRWWVFAATFRDILDITMMIKSLNTDNGYNAARYIQFVQQGRRRCTRAQVHGLYIKVPRYN